MFNLRLVPLFNLRLVSLFMIEHLVIVLNPNNPKRITTKKVPNFDLLDEFLRGPFPKQGLFPVKTIIIVSSYPQKFMHDEEEDLS